MELRHLRYFVALAEELHFGRAAQRLFLAQPSLSNQIRKLENELGTPLFTRTRQKVALTAAGQALLEPATSVIEAADRLPSLVRRAVGGAGQLTIGYVPYARGQLLSGLLDSFRLAAPRAEVIVRSGSDSPEVFADLRDGRIDAAIVRAPVSATWLQRLTLAVEPFYAALPSAHPLTSRSKVRLADLAGESFGLFPRELNPPAHDHLMTFFAEAGYQPTIGQASRRMDESVVFVASGGGVGLFPASVADTVHEPGLTFRPITDPTPTVEIVLAWDENSLNPLLPVLAATARRLTTSRFTAAAVRDKATPA